MSDEKQVFARASFAEEVFTKENENKFNDLPAWQRHLIKRVIDHGNLDLAAKEANVSRHVKDVVDQKRVDELSAEQVLNQNGLSFEKLIPHIRECLDAQGMRLDKHGNVVSFTDLKMKLATIDMIFKLTGMYPDKPKKIRDKEEDTEELFSDIDVENSGNP